MKFKKFAAFAACGALAASIGMFGCSGSNESSSASSNASASDTATTYEVINDGKLTVILSPDYPPFENMENGELEGFEVDLFKAIAEEMGLEYNPVTMQFDGIIPAIVAGGQGDIGVSGFSVNPERAKEIDFTTTFYIDNQGVAVMKDSGITKENAETDLNKSNVTIAVQTGTTGADYAKEHFPNAKIQGYGNSTDCFAAMQSGNATAVCTNLAVVENMISTAYQDAEIVYEAPTGEEYAAIVSQGNPQLTAALNEAIAKLQENGTIASLEQKWFG